MKIEELQEGHYYETKYGDVIKVMYNDVHHSEYTKFANKSRIGVLVKFILNKWKWDLHNGNGGCEYRKMKQYDKFEYLWFEKEGKLFNVSIIVKELTEYEVGAIII